MYPYRFGPYILLQPLGEGGMGKVALALGAERGRERLCVVKRLHARYLKDAQLRRRFDDEAAISRRLAHPNLVDTIAAGEVDGEPFIAQGFVDGRDLSELIDRARSRKIQVPPSLWVHIVREIAQGLAYAHDFENLGLVHRDINPPNIRIGFSGEVKLIDFGLAKWKDKSSLTAQGSLLGKTAYISPEQLKNDPPDRRSDLYVLGVVLWELLAGQFFGTILKDGRPVYADGDRAALARLFSPVVIPPSRFAPAVTADLDEVVIKSLAPNPADRFQTAGDFANALAGFMPTDFVPSTRLAELMRLGFASEIETRNRQSLIEAGRVLLRTPLVAEPLVMEPRQQDIGVVTATRTEREKRAGLSSRAKMGIVLAGLVALSIAGMAWVRGRPAVPRPSPAAPQLSPALAVPVPEKILAPPDLPTRPEDRATVPRVRQPVATKVPAEHHARGIAAESTQASPVQQAKDAFSAGDLDRALRLAKDALAQGADADAWIVVGNVDFKRRLYADAGKAYQEALKLQPNNETILKRRQMALKLAAGGESSP